jgi:hypothetical protein
VVRELYDLKTEIFDAIDIDENKDGFSPEELEHLIRIYSKFLDKYENHGIDLLVFIQKQLQSNTKG